MSAAGDATGNENQPIGQQDCDMAVARASHHGCGGRPCAGGRIIQLRSGLIDATVAESAHDQHFSIGKQRRRLLITVGGHRAGHHPRSRDGVVKFRSVCYARDRRAPANQHFAILKQGRRELIPSNGHRTGIGPRAGGRIVKLRAVGGVADGAETAGDQHFSVQQQRRRVSIPHDGHWIAGDETLRAGRQNS